MPRRDIDLGNAEDVIVRGRSVTIIPASQGVDGRKIRKNRVIRAQGLDVINGTERSNPDSIPVTDSDYPGWRAVGTIPGEEIAVTNNLTSGWTEAWLVLHVTITLIGYSAFDVTVTAASLEDTDSYPNSYPVWKNNPGDGSMTTATGVYSFPVATTVSGSRRMVNFHQYQFWWDEYKNPAYAAQRYIESISPAGLNDCGIGYSINVSAVASSTASNRCYMDSVSSPYSGDDLFLTIKEVLA